MYQAGSSGPLVYCIHGGGYTGLTWALVASKLKDRQVSGSLRMFGGGAPRGVQQWGGSGGFGMHLAPYPQLTHWQVPNSGTRPAGPW